MSVPQLSIFILTHGGFISMEYGPILQTTKRCHLGSGPRPGQAAIPLAEWLLIRLKACNGRRLAMCHVLWLLVACSDTHTQFAPHQFTLYWPPIRCLESDKRI